MDESNRYIGRAPVFKRKRYRIRIVSVVRCMLISSLYLVNFCFVIDQITSGRSSDVFAVCALPVLWCVLTYLCISNIVDTVHGINEIRHALSKYFQINFNHSLFSTSL